MIPLNYVLICLWALIAGLSQHGYEPLHFLDRWSTGDQVVVLVMQIELAREFIDNINNGSS